MQITYSMKLITSFSSRTDRSRDAKISTGDTSFNRYTMTGLVFDFAIVNLISQRSADESIKQFII